MCAHKRLLFGVCRSCAEGIPTAAEDHPILPKRNGPGVVDTFPPNVFSTSHHIGTMLTCPSDLVAGSVNNAGDEATLISVPQVTLQANAS